MAVQRDHFNSRLGFILAAAGSAVGLGNIWKFPFEVGRGGGAAFVVIYLVFCFVLCFPVMVAEIAIGRKTALNPVGAFKALGYRNWSFIGYMGVLTGMLILSYYNVAAAWSFGYFIEMLFGHFEIGGQFGAFTADWIKVGLYAFFFMGATALVVSQGVSQGIERAAKILMPALLIVILLLIAYAMTLPHATDGLEFYLKPDFSKLSGRVIYSALGQAFFSLSLGMGALITYGSYVSRSANIVSSAALITVCDAGIAFLAGFMIFPFVFYQGLDTTGGPGLIFVTLPGVFASLGPTLGVFIGAVFFLLLSFAAFTSTISLLEVPMAYLVDEHRASRKISTWLTALVIFLIGLPSLLSNGAVDSLSKFVHLPGRESSVSFMDLVGLVANDTSLPLGGFLIAAFTAYVWRKENLKKELADGAESGRGGFMRSYVNFSLSYVCPLILGLLSIVTILDNYFGLGITAFIFG